MKKLLTTLVFALATLTTTAQGSDFTTVLVQEGEINQAQDNYLWGKLQKVKIDFTFHNNVMIVADEAQSAYTTTSYETEDGIDYFVATDELGINCMVVIYEKPKYQIVEVWYANWAVRYYFKNKNK